MSFKRTLFYALLLGVLGFYIYQVEIPREEAEERKELLFPDLSRNEIERIEIRRKDESFALLNSEPAKDGPAADGETSDDPLDAEKWRIEGLQGGAVDSASLGSLVSALKELKLESALPSEEVEKDEGIYGLAEPSLAVSVEIPEATKEVRFGKLNEYVGKRYAKVSGSKDLYLLSDWLFNVANKPRDEFRSRTPVSFLDSDVKSAVFSAGDAEIALERLDHGEWRLTKPIEAKASSAAVSDLLRAVKNLRAAKFVDGRDDSLQDFGLDRPAVRVRIDPKDPNKLQPIDVLIGAAAAKEGTGESYYFKIAAKPGIYEISTDPRPQLQKTAEELRERKLFSFPVEKVKEATFVPNEGDTISLVNAEKGWLVNGKDGDDAFVRQILNDISNIEAVAFPPKGAAAGFESPRLTVTLKMSGDLAERKLVIGGSTEHDGKPAYFAGVDDLTVTFLVGEEDFRKIFVKEEALLPVQPTASPAAVAATQAPSIATPGVWKSAETPAPAPSSEPPPA